MGQRFSEGMGITAVRQTVQIESMDDALRNRLWNALDLSYWDRMQDGRSRSGPDEVHSLCRKMWDQYFKRPVDTLGNRWSDTRGGIREYFFNAQWYEVYDLLEFVAGTFPNQDVNRVFRYICNSILVKELAGYRFVDDTITQVTSDEEISAIEQALQNTSHLATVRDHVQTGLRLMSDRQAPDYRNSMKESISAVEALCCLVAGTPKATLGQALDALERQGKVGLHGALKQAFEKLYGYTSDAEGIRHALLDEPTLDFEDAKFFLVSCSAFINYLIEKASKAGIAL